MDRVRLTWEPVPGAAEYIIYRGNRDQTLGGNMPVLVDRVSGTTWDDPTAIPVPGPLAPADVVVTATASAVTLTWSQPRLTGEQLLQYNQFYAVAALGPDGPGTRVIAEGRRAEPWPEGYGVRLDGNIQPQTITATVNEVTGRWSWSDSAGPAPTLELEGLSASQGTFDDFVELTLQGYGFSDGAPRTYQVVTLLPQGFGPASAEVQGSRSFPGQVSFEWLRSLDAEGTDFEAFSTFDGIQLLDTDAPEDGTQRFYNILLRAPGVADVTLSEPVPGWRRVAPYEGIPCDPETPFSDQCPTGYWCAELAPAGHRFCAPYLSAGVGEDPFEFRYVPAGSFTMGTPVGGVFRQAVERLTSVSLTRPFWMQTTEVTVAQWAHVANAWNNSGRQPQMGANPSYAATPGLCNANDCPVERVNLADAAFFANALSILEGLDPCYELVGCSGDNPGSGCSGLTMACGGAGVFTCSAVHYAGPACNGYRLPTEAEWEYAARAGTTTNTYVGEVTQQCDPLFDFIAHSLCRENDRGNAVRVRGSRFANLWGFHDMIGNVAEWTIDLAWCLHSDGDRDPVCSVISPPPAFESRVVKGGGFMSEGDFMRAGARQSATTVTRDRAIGIRLVRTVSPDPED